MSRYNIPNSKSGRHNQRHTFRCCNSQHKPISTNIPYNGLMVKGRKSGNTTAPSPCRQNWILYVLNLCQDIPFHGSTKLKSLLRFDKLDIGNNHLLTDSGYDNNSYINLPFHRTLNQIYSSTNLLDDVILTEVIIRPTEKPRSVGPHK